MNDMFNGGGTITERWLLAEFHSNHLLECADTDPSEHEVVKSLSPFLNHYYSPLNPVLSPFYLKHLRSLGREESIWLRDGVIPLTWFFRTMRPEEIKCRLIVNERLARFVPREWRAQCSFYRIQGRSFKNPKELILVAPVAERVCTLEQSEEILDRTLRYLRGHSPKVKVFCPIREPSETFPAEFFALLYRKFPGVETTDWFELVNTPRFEDTLYVELNGEWLYADSFVQHHMLSRGAGLLPAPEKKQKKREVKLSRFHCTEIFDRSDVRPLQWDNDLMKYCEQIAGHTDGGQKGLWPDWHESWCHALE